MPMFTWKRIRQSKQWASRQWTHPFASTHSGRTESKLHYCLLYCFAMLLNLFYSKTHHLLNILNIDKQKRLFSLRSVDIIGKVSSYKQDYSWREREYECVRASDGFCCVVAVFALTICFKLIRWSTRLPIDSLDVYPGTASITAKWLQHF